MDLMDLESFAVDQFWNEIAGLKKVYRCIGKIFHSSLTNEEFTASSSH